MVARLIDCPDCGHCVDLKTPNENDSKELTAVREEISATILRWLEEDKAQTLEFLKM